MGLMDGKVAVVTGAARGQGRAHARRLAEEGADIIAMDICRDVETVAYPGARPEDLEETVATVEALDRRIVASQTDVRDADAVNAAIEDGIGQLGSIDCLVANHGICTYAPVEEVTRESWTTMIEVNLTGPWNVAQAVVRHLLENDKGGAIVFTSSAASYVGLANVASYSAAKAGLVGLMQSMAVELGPKGIRVNTIHPGTVRTPMVINDETFRVFAPGSNLSADREEDIVRAGEATAPMHVLDVPWMEPVEIANGALYLCSDMGSHVTGTQLRIDAGQGVK